MRYFTNNPLERLMMQKPKAAREDSPPDAAKEHFCNGRTALPTLPRNTSATAASASDRAAFAPATVT